MARQRSCRIRRSSLKPLLCSFLCYATFTLLQYDSGPNFVTTLTSPNSWMPHLRAVGIWIGQKILHGAAVLSLIIATITLYSVVRDVCRWFTRAPSLSSLPNTTTPAELESGSANLAPPPHPPETRKNFLAFLLFAVSFASITYIAPEGSFVSPKDSLLENVGSCLMYFLRGLEILFVGLLLVRSMEWLRERYIPAVGRDVELEPLESQAQTGGVPIVDGDGKAEEKLPIPGETQMKETDEV
ncbi:hypothetical protein R3P38DRAFT_2586376 [Favolaschia claudopus]|uniref:Uncharacterized protein n=1 Tax=Favolaschia claudopus TaxID=2862362 RepID=A0AAV9Z5H4_9AGAR